MSAPAPRSTVRRAARGNSVYFPDRVVPMLPETLSADICSLVENQDRGVLACHITIDADGKMPVATLHPRRHPLRHQHRL